MWYGLYVYTSTLLQPKRKIVCLALIINVTYFYKPLFYEMWKDLNWGSSKQTQQIKTILKNTYSADTVQYHVKNYLPNIMVLSGEPKSRKELVHLAHLITKNNGLQMCINIKKVGVLFV